VAHVCSEVDSHHVDISGRQYVTVAHGKYHGSVTLSDISLLKGHTTFRASLEHLATCYRPINFYVIHRVPKNAHFFISL